MIHSFSIEKNLLEVSMEQHIIGKHLIRRFQWYITCLNTPINEKSMTDNIMWLVMHYTQYHAKKIFFLHFSGCENIRSSSALIPDQEYVIFMLVHLKWIMIRLFSGLRMFPNNCFKKLSQPVIFLFGSIFGFLCLAGIHQFRDLYSTYTTYPRHYMAEIQVNDTKLHDQGGLHWRHWIWN